MCEMKCPICQNNLHKINIIVSTCTNDKCKLWGSSIPNLVLEALAQAKQNLEQSEKCCTEWEKQALDYKAENIALSGDLERTRKALDVAVDILKLVYQGNGDPQDIVRYKDNRWISVRRLCMQALDEITALEQKDVK